MTKQLRVLHVYKTSLPSTYGGIETFIDALCKANSKLGVKNSVLTLHPSPQKYPIELDGYTVYQAKQNLFLASTGFSISAFKKFQVLANSSDIIHYHFPNPFADLLHLVCRPKKPTIVTYHSDIVRQKWFFNIYKPLMKKFLSSVNHIVASSPNYFASSEVLEQNAEKVSIIPFGINLRNFEIINSEHLEYWRSRLSAPFFLFLGSLRYYKGLEFALGAIRGSKIKLVIAGAGEMEQKLKVQSAKYKLDNIAFVGQVSDEDKVALLQLSYGFVFPSYLRSEAFGIALLEAAASGKPLISCEIGTGSSYVNVNNLTGLVVNPGSESDLRDAMLFLLDNPKIAYKMGLNAKERALRLFSEDKQALAYTNLYRDLLAVRSPQFF